MRQFFSPDSKFMRFMGTFKDLMVLGLLFLMTSLPVLTLGASFTALQYAALKLARGESSGASRDYFRSFKLNFRQSTAIFLIYFVLLLLCAWSLYLYFANPGTFESWMLVVLLVVTALLLMILIYTLALQSKFDNSTFRTVKNGLMMTLTHLLRALLMLVLYLIPLFIFRNRRPAIILNSGLFHHLGVGFLPHSDYIGLLAHALVREHGLAHLNCGAGQV